MKIKDLVDILDQYNEKSEVTVSTSECLDDAFPLTKVAVIHRGADIPVNILLVGGGE